MVRVEATLVVAVWLLLVTSLWNAPRTPPGHDPVGGTGLRLYCPKMRRTFLRLPGRTHCPYCGVKLN